jgi:two-component system, sensor histidine kinase and response regulator
MLLSMGVRLALASDRAEVHAMLAAADKSEPYGLLLVDQELQDAANWTFLRQIRQRHPAVRLVLLSSWDSGPQSDSCIDACLPKPIRHSQLFNALVETVGREGNSHKKTSTTSTMTAAKRLAKTRGNRRILVAEDNEVNQIVTQQVLIKSGYQCDIVANGKEALDALENGPYAAVLMDCQMPEMDGFEATRIVRQRERESPRPEALPIIALTANALSGDRQRCLEAGMTDYITKPIDPLALITLLETHLQAELDLDAAAQERSPSDVASA